MASIIYEILDTYLQKMVDSGVNTASEVAPEMISPEPNDPNELKTWIPVTSEITDEEITAFEEKIGVKLPKEYINFLKYKHFYELHIGEASFCTHPINRWQEALENMIFNSYPKEYLYENGLIHFADWSDWGALCFDIRRNYFTADYPVVLWDHEVPDFYTDYAMNFKVALKKLDKEDKVSWGGSANEKQEKLDS